MTLEAFQEPREGDQGRVIPRSSEPHGEVLAADLNRNLRLVLRAGEEDAGVVYLASEVLSYHFLGRLHGGNEEGDAVYPIDARLRLMGGTQSQAHDVLEKGAGVGLFDDFVYYELLIRRVGYLQWKDGAGQPGSLVVLERFA